MGLPFAVNLGRDSPAPSEETTTMAVNLFVINDSDAEFVYLVR